VTPTAKQQATVNLASRAGAAPSLSAPAARLLPPLPSRHRSPQAGRGLLAQWAHDVGSWL
jgi:hypothetical protein